MSSGIQTAPPGITNVDRGPTVITIACTELAIAILAVAARFWARLIIHRLGTDDWLMLGALGLMTAYAILLTVDASLGGFRHIYFLTPAESTQILKINYIAQLFVVLSYVVGKAAVGFLVLRIMGKNSDWRKWLIYTVMILTAVVGILDSIFTYAQCNPPQALWDPSVPHTCWAPSVQANFAIFTSSENIFADVVLAFVPVSIIYGLNLNRQKRISLSILLTLGLLAAICAIIKTTFLAELGVRTDYTWATYNLLVWSNNEIFVIIVCGSIPPMKTLWDRFVLKKSYKSYKMSGTNGSSNMASKASRLGRINYSDITTTATITNDDAQRLAPSSNQIMAMTDIEVIREEVKV